MNVNYSCIVLSSNNLFQSQACIQLLIEALKLHQITTNLHHPWLLVGDKLYV